MGWLKIQRVVSFAWIAFSLLFIWASLHLKVGTPAHPGPGFMPLLIGLFMATVSLITLAKEYKTENDPKLFDRRHLRKHILLFGLLITYCLIIDYLGFLISTFILMLFLFKGIEPQKWSTAIFAAIRRAGMASSRWWMPSPNRAIWRRRSSISLASIRAWRWTAKAFYR